jgi:hypothetical protein
MTDDVVPDSQSFDEALDVTITLCISNSNNNIGATSKSKV